MVKYAIGIDIGGTKISLVLGDSTGDILAQQVLPTLKGKFARQSVSEITQHCASLILRSKISKSKIIGIGIGIPGPVDSKMGRVPRSPHMTGWEGIPLARLIHSRLKLPVFMTNDANAAALGEKMFGGGEKNFAYLTISTGIGGGLIANGELIEGDNFMGGEVGHMKIVAGGRRCKCGKDGCLEAYASGTAIATASEAALRKGARSNSLNFLRRQGKLCAKEIGFAARSGDKLALQLYEEAGFYLGVGISNLLHLINPGRVVLGGGVLKSAPSIFWKSMRASCRKASWPPAYESVRLTRSKLGDHVGDLGALARVFDQFKRP